MLTGINHLTIAVKDLAIALDFYVATLGMRPIVKWREGAYLKAGELWLCLSCGESRPAKDYSHVAFSIPEEHFTTFAARMKERSVPIWKENSSEGESIYILDPDGHKLEVHAGNLATRLEQLKAAPYEELHWY